MYIFLDESGDLGFDFSNQKTSRYFSITLLACETRESLFLIRSAAKKILLRKLNAKTKHPKSEIKGTNTTLEIKKYFYKKIEKNCNFFIHTVILDKQKLLAQAGKVDKHKIYTKISNLALKNVNIRPDAPFVHIIADRCKRGIEAKDFSFSLRSDIEKFLPWNSIVTMEQIPSTTDCGLQAVDLFSYGIFSKHEFDDLEWYTIFKEKIASETLI